jgi:hypothetical protein
MQIDSCILEQYTGHTVIMQQKSTGVEIIVHLSSTSQIYNDRDYVYGVGYGVLPNAKNLIHYRFKKWEPISDTNVYLITNTNDIYAI